MSRVRVWKLSIVSGGMNALTDGQDLATLRKWRTKSMNISPTDCIVFSVCEVSSLDEDNSKTLILETKQKKLPCLTNRLSIQICHAT